MNSDEARDVVVAMFDGWYSSLVRYAFRATGSLALAEDVVQESLMRLYRRLSEGEAIENPKAWTMCVVRHEIGRHVRRHAKIEALEESADLVEASLGVRGEIPEMRDAVLGLLSVLTKREEEVLMLRLDALKYREIAAELAISVKTVGTLLARAVRKLRREMGLEPEPSRPPDLMSDVEEEQPETLH